MGRLLQVRLRPRLSPAGDKQLLRRQASTLHQFGSRHKLTPSRNGWGASAVDAFSTALVMQNWEVVNQVLAFVQTINFDTAIGDVSLFETTIRYLGGLLSGEFLGVAL